MPEVLFACACRPAAPPVFRRFFDGFPSVFCRFPASFFRFPAGFCRVSVNFSADYPPIIRRFSVGFPPILCRFFSGCPPVLRRFSVVSPPISRRFMRSDAALYSVKRRAYPPGTIRKLSGVRSFSAIGLTALRRVRIRPDGAECLASASEFSCPLRAFCRSSGVRFFGRGLHDFGRAGGITAFSSYICNSNKTLNL